MHSYQNNPEKSSSAKTNMHTLSGYSLFTNCLFDSEKKNFFVIEVKTVWKVFVRIVRI